MRVVRWIDRVCRRKFALRMGRRRRRENAVSFPPLQARSVSALRRGQRGHCATDRLGAGHGKAPDTGLAGFGRRRPIPSGAGRRRIAAATSTTRRAALRAPGRPRRRPNRRRSARPSSRAGSATRARRAARATAAEASCRLRTRPPRRQAAQPARRCHSRRSRAPRHSRRHPRQRGTTAIGAMGRR